jgi:hypothetical protein
MAVIGRCLMMRTRMTIFAAWLMLMINNDGIFVDGSFRVG